MTSDENLGNLGGATLAGKITTLEDAQKMIEELQKKLKAQSCQFLAWHRKFKIQEDIIMQIIQQRNDQLKSLSMNLIMFEARLHRKQKEIATLLAQRETVISKQHQMIKMLQNQLTEAGFKCADDIPFDTTNDSDSAVILDDEENYMNYQLPSTDGVTVMRSISDVIQQPNSIRIYNMRRNSGYLRRPEILETVYSVEEDADGDDNESSKAGARVYSRDKLRKFQHSGSIERLDDEGRKEPTPHVNCFNRVMSNHRSVTKPKDVKYKRINKAKSKSLEELRGRLKNWVEKSNRFSFSFDRQS